MRGVDFLLRIHLLPFDFFLQMPFKAKDIHFGWLLHSAPYYNIFVQPPAFCKNRRIM